MSRKICSKGKNKSRKSKKDVLDKRQKKHSSTHHYIPTSRGGSDEDWNKKRTIEKLHMAWHNLFANLKPFEVITLIRRRWINPDGSLKIEEFGYKQLISWKILFKDKNPEQAIRTIRNKWFPRMEDYEKWIKKQRSKS